MIEYFFKPDEDFIYFDKYEELPGIIKEVTNNWDDYSGIIDSAYEKAVSSYTCQKLFKHMSQEG